MKTREEKKRETRCRIIEAAKRLFSEQGYESTTVAQITDAAGVAKGTFFNYFENKDDIMCNLQERWAVEEIARLKDKPGPVVPRLNALLLELVGGLQMNRSLARAMLVSFMSSSFAMNVQGETYGLLRAGLEPVMEAGQRQGEFTTVMPASMLAEAALQTFYGVLLHYALEQGDDRLSEQMALAFQIFFKGIAP